MSYKAIHLHSYKENIIVGSENKRKPLKGEVMVKVERATVNPSDLYFLKGMYGLYVPKIFPIVPGFEGSGIVEEVGDGVDSSLVGKYCSIGGSVTSPNTGYKGLWAQYYYCKPGNLIIYDRKVNLDRACFAMANPLTAFAFIEICKENNVKAVVQNGAFSALGKMFLKMCIKENINIINLIRREEQISALKSIGAQYVFNTTTKGWEKDFRKTCKSLNASIMFDCVGGDSTHKVFKLLPDNSILIHYGNLEMKKINGFDSGDFIFNNKTIKGFWLIPWLKSLDNNKKRALMQNLVKEIENEKSEIINVDISVETGIENFITHLENYSKDMSKGKILLKPHF